MTAHEQFAEDLALLALGALAGEERSALEKHLDACPGCREELHRLQGDMALLALSASGPQPPARSREKLLSAIAREPRRTPEKSAARPWWKVLEWAAAAAALLVVALVLQQNSDLRRQVAALQSDFAGQQAQLEQAREVVATFTAPESQQVTLVAAKAPPQPQGKAFYLRGKGSLVFLASNMPSLPAGKAYELWLIPVSGSPIPAGIFKPNAHGSATVVNPPLQAGVQAKAFAITVEPEAGSASPSSQPVMVGAGE